MREPTVVVGRVTRAHGIRGEVAVLVLSETPERFAADATVFLEDGTPLTVERSRPHGGRLLVKFREVADRTRAEELRGRLLVIPESMLPPLPEGAWWPHQIEGCEVVTESGRSLGRVVEVVPNPANDLWVARAGETETMIPALRDVLVSVDVRAKRIVVREVPGLTAPAEG
ncbi:MAG TPA: ribosome maturation factor RimM [Actinomycetota bacterium]|nr:ribosome maturation factor RimM [Actinomycetota bacterium]